MLLRDGRPHFHKPPTLAKSASMPTIRFSRRKTQHPAVLAS
jgi:hypothetical protein